MRRRPALDGLPARRRAGAGPCVAICNTRRSRRSAWRDNWLRVAVPRRPRAAASRRSAPSMTSAARRAIRAPVSVRRRPPLADPAHQLLAARGRRDESAVGDDVGHGLVTGVPDPGPQRQIAAPRWRGPRARRRRRPGRRATLRPARAPPGRSPTPDTARSARMIEAGAPAPWTLARNSTTEKAKPDCCSWPTKSLNPSDPGLATRPMRRATSGTASAWFRSSRPSGSSVSSSAARRAASRPSRAVTSTSEAMKLIWPLGW